MKNELFDLQNPLRHQNEGSIMYLTQVVGGTQVPTWDPSSRYRA